MERERTAPAGDEVSPEERRGVARVARLPQLLDAIAVSHADDARELATELNELLIAMRAPGQEAAESAVVQQALASKRLHQLVDNKGRHCRKEAVETLLATGFPHALEVSPEDLAFARAYRPKPAKRREPPNEWKENLSSRKQFAGFGAAAGSGVTASWLAVQVIAHGGDAVHGASILLAIVSAWVAIAFARRPADPNDLGTFGTAFAISGLLQLLCAAGVGAATVPAVAGSVLAFATLFGDENTNLRDR